MTQPISIRLPSVLDCRPAGPTYAVWEVTLRCNQKCRFCGSRAGRPRSDELSTAESIDVVSQLAKMGTREVTLHGGEAYLRPDWLELVRAIRDHGIAPTMVTGGRGFDAQMARAAKAAGIAAVSVSVDGLEQTHDALRGVRGSHASATAALSHFRNADVPVACITQVNQQNLRQLPELLQTLRGYSLYAWQVQLMVPMGRAADSSDLWLEPYDLLELIPTLARLRVTCDELGVKLWPADNIGYFGPFEHTLRHQRSRSGHSGGCGGGILAIGIEAHGAIKPCSAMGGDECVGGNARARPLQEIWDHAPEMRRARDFTVEQLWGYCRDCYYAEVCRAGCMWTAATLLGRHGNQPYCHHRASQLLSANQRERLVQVKGAAGLIRDRGRFELEVETAPAAWADQMRQLERAVLAELERQPPSEARHLAAG